MRSSIAFKLFLAILASCLVVALAMGVAVRYSFDSGFDDYVQQRETQRLEDLAQILAADYQQSGSWQFLLEDHGRWWRSVRMARHLQADGPDQETNGFLPRITLVAEDGTRLAGPRVDISLKTLHRYPVEAGGHAVGWLLSPPLMSQIISDEIDQRFQSRQLRATWVIVGLSVLLAALVSWLLARLLLVPVRRITQATHRLASGHYDTRVRVRTADELGRLARDFNRLAHSLERNRRLRHELMADVSHELRTPLAVLRGEIEALQDKLRPLDDAALASLGHEVARLNQLIDDLYTLSLADAGALNYHFQALDFSRLVQQAADAVRDRIVRAGHSLDVQVAPRLMLLGDEQRLNQLLANLLENSLRYTDAPGRIRVRAWRQGAHVFLEMADSAPGVAADRLARIFDRLYRAESSRSRRYGGAGLGLALCRSIVQAHGGQIQALASPLGGLAILIQWPEQHADAE